MAMEEQDQRVKLPDAVGHEGLVTERDIDPAFGLFTEDEKIGKTQAQDTETPNAPNEKKWEGIGD
jgi:hypothetical protein